MYPTRNPFLNVNVPASKGPRSRSISLSSSRSFQSPAPMTPQGLLASPQNEASRPILGRKDADDQFPMDTVHRIYTDIEKLFIDETDSPPSTPSYSPIFDSGSASKYFPTNQSSQACNGVSLTSSLNPSESYNNSAEQYFHSCYNEIVALDALLSESSDSKILGANSSQTIQGGKSNLQSPLFSQPQPMVSKRTFDGLTTIDAASLNSLHIFIHRIYLLHDKLKAFIQVNSYNGFSRMMDGDQNINEILEQWYLLGMNLKDRLIAVNSFPELSLTLAAFQPKQVSKLWRFTRLLRIFVWKRKNPSSNTAISSNGFALNQAAYEHKYSGHYGNYHNNNNYYFGK